MLPVAFLSFQQAQVFLRFFVLPVCAPDFPPKEIAGSAGGVWTFRKKHFLYSVACLRAEHFARIGL
jgi:hypothetical protein